MSKTILIVDDSVSLRQAVQIALKKAGYETVEACDGLDALTRLDGRKIHLILSDVNMPNMDGISFVRRVKMHPGYKFTPVIMLTTEGKPARMAEGRAVGAKAWITKPFQTTQVLDVVARLMLP